MEYVSIPVWFDWELIKAQVTAGNLTRFNSSMVRLGVSIYQSFGLSSSVSIPVWFDWELVTDRQTIRLFYTFQFQYGSIGSEPVPCKSLIGIKFQFQYGSIGSPNALLISKVLFRFNSSMVRLGVAQFVGFVHYYQVSIPVWFDWEIGWSFRKDTF